MADGFDASRSPGVMDPPKRRDLKDSTAVRVAEVVLAPLTVLVDADWQPIATALCNDIFARVRWADGAETIEDLGHDSDPDWWAERGATHWCPVKTWINENDHD
jgi:hypothetical protein